MSSTSSAASELARRLIALEAAPSAGRAASGGEAARICEKLRTPLARFAGVAGYRALVSRAVAMAKAEAPSLLPLQVQADGSLLGFHEIEPESGEAGAVVIVYLLTLLLTFVGKPLTISLVRDVWPDASPDLDDKGLSAEEQP